MNLVINRQLQNYETSDNINVTTKQKYETSNETKGDDGMKLALIGAGSRGTIYASYAHEEKKMEIAAVVEPDRERREIARGRFHIPEAMCFESTTEFFSKGKVADAVILASMDQNHYEQATAAIDAGYDILLEKPISPNPRECLEIQNRAEAAGRTVVVCHVLRYTNFFSTIKEIVDSGRLGKIVTIQHAENIGNFHMAHSFVRGNWRNSDQSSPIIMQKSCHDMDILVWLTGARAKKISSFGNLSYFKKENAPEGSAENCLLCPVAQTCRYDVKKAYLPIAGSWPANVVCADQSRDGLLKALETSPYGRCVYKCDNNVCDNQVTCIEFDNGVTATFHLSAFTNRTHRTIKVMCEQGDIYGDDALETLIVTRYAPNEQETYETETIHLGITSGGHGGGDVGLMEDFLELADKGECKESRSSISRSVESHLMAYAAEKSRVTAKTVDMDELRKELSR